MLSSSSQKYMLLFQLFNMTPYFPSHNIPNNRLGNSYFISNKLLAIISRKIHSSDQNYFLICEFGVSAIFSKALPIFKNHIIDIVGRFSNRKMERINAKFVITRVHNDHSFRNFTFMNFIRKTMSINSMTSKSSITRSAWFASPYPTRFSFYNIIKKSSRIIGHLIDYGMSYAHQSNWAFQIQPEIYALKGTL